MPTDNALVRHIRDEVLKIIETRIRCEHMAVRGLPSGRTKYELPDGRVHTVTALNDVAAQVRDLLATMVGDSDAPSEGGDG